MLVLTGGRAVALLVHAAARIDLRWVNVAPRGMVAAAGEPGSCLGRRIAVDALSLGAATLLLDVSSTARPRRHRCSDHRQSGALSCR